MDALRSFLPLACGRCPLQALCGRCAESLIQSLTNLCNARVAFHNCRATAMEPFMDSMCSISGFLRGWLPNYLRVGPQTVLIFVFVEQLRRAAGLQDYRI